MEAQSLSAGQELFPVPALQHPIVGNIGRLLFDQLVLAFSLVVHKGGVG